MEFPTSKVLATIGKLSKENSPYCCYICQKGFKKKRKYCLQNRFQFYHGLRCQVRCMVLSSATPCFLCCLILWFYHKGYRSSHLPLTRGSFSESPLGHSIAAFKGPKTMFLQSPAVLK